MQVMPIAAAGLNDAINRFDISARQTVADPLDNPVQRLVEQIQARTEVKANAAVIRTADAMTGTVLDMFA
ncbi:MAG: flagellar hook protein FlgE [Caulobacter sp.]|nr:flagellar hook protein FlgE [Caulobacter sp.]